jgi:hypothetical protein
MSLIVRMRKQKAIYWALASQEESGSVAFDDEGQAVFADPVEITCRWEDVVNQIPQRDGTMLGSSSKVYVDRDMNVGEMLLLGELDDIDSGFRDDPKEAGALAIMNFSKIPNLRNTELLRVAYL